MFLRMTPMELTVVPAEDLAAALARTRILRARFTRIAMASKSKPTSQQAYLGKESKSLQ